VGAAGSEALGPGAQKFVSGSSVFQRLGVTAADVRFAIKAYVAASSRAVPPSLVPASNDWVGVVCFGIDHEIRQLAAR
jgi:hypothetical protein